MMRVAAGWSVTQCVAMTYFILKTVHIVAAVTAISGFLLRGYWMLTDSDKLQRRVTRILPHVVDTIFLLSGVAFTKSPFSWLMVSVT